MDDAHRFLRAETDGFVGRRISIERYLVVSLSGFFPVLVRTGDGSLAVVFRTEGPHIGITGTLAVSTSEDGGRSWSDSNRVTPRWEDARNPAFGHTSDGRLILSYWAAVRHAYLRDESGWSWEPKSPEEIEEVPGLAIRSSSDGGTSWTEPEYLALESFLYASPYGRIIEHRGDLLMPVYGRLRGGEPDDIACGILRSSDGGTSWGDETVITKGYNETALLELSDGSLLAASRSQTERNVAIFRSSDAGRSWSAPVEITRRNEHPADLTLLASGAVLLTFGRRIRPFGCGALLSTDGGMSWDFDREALLAGDAAGNTDTGYPSTVQLADGAIVTALYFASGSAMSDHANWGEISCQVLRYDEGLFAGE